MLISIVGYSNGQLSGASNASRTSGGECLDGVRIVVAIGDVPPPTSTPGTVTPTPPPIPPTQDPAGGVYLYWELYIISLTYKSTDDVWK